MRNWEDFLDPTNLTAHGFCLSWEPGLIALHAVSDGLIGLAYFSIPLALASLLRQRRDIQYGWMIYSFVGFIVACGTTHFFSILTLWVPSYSAEGLVKAVTALLSIMTAILLWPLVPRLVALPSPAQLREANVALSTTIKDREQTLEQLRASEARVQASNIQLERRVAERTEALATINRQLEHALAEKTEAQQALVRREAEFRASFEGSVVGKALVEPTSRTILKANKILAEMLGYAPDELVGMTSPDFTYSEDIEADRLDYARLLSGAVDVYIQEKRYVRRDGTPFWVRVSAALARVPESEHPVLTIASVEDIDARRHAEMDLRTAKQTMEQVLADRTRALEQRDLLLREVYHRVKNNLQIVDGLITFQALKLKDPEAREAVDGLHHRICALGLVHHQLMNSDNLKTFDIVPFLESLAENLLEGSADDGVSLTVDATPVQVDLDFAVPFGLLVTELVTNCLKHAQPAEGESCRISISLKIAPDRLVLRVSDNGRLGDGAPALSRPAIGLGTSLVNGLVSQLGGTVTIDGRNGRSTEIQTPRQHYE